MEALYLETEHKGKALTDRLSSSALSTRCSHGETERDSRNGQIIMNLAEKRFNCAKICLMNETEFINNPIGED